MIGDPVNWSVPSKFNMFSVRPVETGKELSIALRDLIKRRFDRDRVLAPGQRLQAHTSCLQSNAPSGAFITRMVMKASSLASQTHPFALLKTTAFALRLAIERIAPVRRGRPVKFDLPSVVNAADVVTAIGGVLHAVASGELTPEEAATSYQVLMAAHFIECGQDHCPHIAGEPVRRAFPPTAEMLSGRGRGSRFALSGHPT